MSSQESFEDLDAWRLAWEPANEVHGFCRRDPLCRDSGLADQVRRAAVSVMNIIAEGWEGIGLGEKRRAHGYARRSCGEVRSMTYMPLDNHFITLEEQAALPGHCFRAGKLISGLPRSVDNRLQPISER